MIVSTLLRSLATDCIIAFAFNCFEQVLGGSSALASIKAQVDAGVRTYHNAACSALGLTRLQFMQREVEDCGVHQLGGAALRNLADPTIPHEEAIEGPGPPVAASGRAPANAQYFPRYQGGWGGQ